MMQVRMPEDFEEVSLSLVSNVHINFRARIHIKS
jgi:hypothetical protein